MTRRFSRQHFALYRGYLDGLPDEQLHRSYGEPGTDVQSTRRMIATLRDALAIAARRARDTGAAHLLRLKPGSLPATPAPDAGPSAAAPSLDAFRDDIDPDGFYSEAELLALHRETWPAVPPGPDARP